MDSRAPPMVPATVVGGARRGAAGGGAPSAHDGKPMAPASCGVGTTADGGGAGAEVAVEALRPQATEMSRPMPTAPRGPDPQGRYASSGATPARLAWPASKRRPPDAVMHAEQPVHMRAPPRITLAQCRAGPEEGCAQGDDERNRAQPPSARKRRPEATEASRVRGILGRAETHPGLSRPRRVSYRQPSSRTSCRSSFSVAKARKVAQNAAFPGL